MCPIPTGRFESTGKFPCGCSCSCPATMTVEEEIHLLEEHKKFMQNQTEVIDKKIAALRAANGP
jgi:hypothetical protein